MIDINSWGMLKYKAKGQKACAPEIPSSLFLACQMCSTCWMGFSILETTHKCLIINVMCCFLLSWLDYMQTRFCCHWYYWARTGRVTKRKSTKKNGTGYLGSSKKWKLFSFFQIQLLNFITILCSRVRLDYLFCLKSRVSAEILLFSAVIINGIFTQ